MSAIAHRTPLRVIKGTTIALIAAAVVAGSAPQKVEASILGGALGGALIGGIIGGKKGAGTGAVVGGIAGALR